MKMQLFPFQEKAVTELRERVAFALDSYNQQRERTYNQIVSLQAPTGSGKTIIMSELIEEILYGAERFAPQPKAVFVWLSDSPALNAQSKDKIDLKADKIRLDQCEIISEESFDQEYLSDGKIYFLNTQKLSKTGKLGKHGDSPRREYTIWETLDNTAREKCDRLYFIIDEAHRGTQDKDEAGKATSIMQRFIKGSEAKKMRPMPLIIGMSATAARFNALVEHCPKCTSTKVIVSAEEVRASGLLKERIIVVYPEDAEKFNETAILQAATREWVDKCKHWREYTRTQHYQNVNPVFVIQVAAGAKQTLSQTNLSLVLSTIEKEIDRKFDEYEVVHTFSGTGDININGLTVHHIEPEKIADDRKAVVVLFKESLSTGWDCPRAETMMSFRRAEDATYIAQLLGRMVRTPLGSHVEVDPTLNEVRLFLPYYNRGNVDAVIDELASAEGGELPTFVDDEELSGEPPMPLSVHGRKKHDSKNPNQQALSFVYPLRDPPNPKIGELQQTVNSCHNPIQPQEATPSASEIQEGGIIPPEPDTPNAASSPPKLELPEPPQESEQIPLLPELDREKVLHFLNAKSFLTYQVKDVRVNNYLKSLHDLASILTTTAIFRDANNTVRDDVTGRIHDYAESLRAANVYQKQKKDILEMKLSVQMFDVFGKELRYEEQSLFTDTLLERQCEQVDRDFVRPMVNAYINRYGDTLSEEDCRIDCILFDTDAACKKELHEYAKAKFHELDDAYRSKIANKDERCRRQYNAVIARGDAVSKHSLFLPENLPSYKPKNGDGEYYQHLYADEDGLYKTTLNTWERGTLEEEMRRPDFVCWLRNLAKASWALCIPYEMGNVDKPMYPDFLIVRMDGEGGYVVDVLEPHGDQYADSLPKAKGMAKYAAQEERLGRVQMIREVTDKATKKKRYRRLDFTKGEVREKIREAMTTDELDHIFKTYGKYEDG